MRNFVKMPWFFFVVNEGFILLHAFSYQKGLYHVHKDILLASLVLSRMIPRVFLIINKLIFICFYNSICSLILNSVVKYFFLAITTFSCGLNFC